MEGSAPAGRQQSHRTTGTKNNDGIPRNSIIPSKPKAPEIPVNIGASNVVPTLLLAFKKTDTVELFPGGN
jgi:hypothetical protein